MRNQLIKSIRILSGGIILVGLISFAGCTLRHEIEPSDKPLVVNLNVKIDHEIRVKIKEQNEDILNLEEEYLKENKTDKEKG